MHLRSYLVLFFLGAMLLEGLDGSGGQRAHAASVTPPPQAPTQSTIDEVAPDGDVIVWLEDNGEPDAEEIDWNTLIPENWRPDVLMKEYDVENISDDDPRAKELLEKLKALWQEAPIVSELDGRRVKLPGFVVPLEMDPKKIDQFLLVPYYGACIHVPPPPANQTVHVLIREGKAFEGQLFDVVWVTGTLRVEHLSSELADAGYRMENATVIPYE